MGNVHSRTGNTPVQADTESKCSHYKIHNFPLETLKKKAPALALTQPLHIFVSATSCPHWRWKTFCNSDAFPGPPQQKQRCTNESRRGNAAHVIPNNSPGRKIPKRWSKGKTAEELNALYRPCAPLQEETVQQLAGISSSESL